ncbi:hypothetical protein BMWSH_p10010 (plasmid) [Priestia megaterium WSH-002]|uniref:Uncharacterized protein n=1 Tax=Priestia megaterium (strain WSH-002) TaxID=1006007 RepID=A0A8D3X3V3_PRIMW|nr:hypothetical protein BMWSH_p10010 [Priestia megaterium WSH-002]
MNILYRIKNITNTIKTSYVIMYTEEVFKISLNRKIKGVELVN